jgi:hypothetical protein
VNEIAGVRVGHLAPSLRDSHHTLAAFPTLKRGANNHCAYGARRTGSASEMYHIFV